MNWINDDKLTAYDRQVLTMATMDAGSWRLAIDTMGHRAFGSFVPSLWRFGMQIAAANGGTAHFRMLSWRGQIRLKQRYNEMLSSAVDVDQVEPLHADTPTASSALLQANQFSQQMMQQAYAPNRMLTATEILQRQMQARQNIATADALKYQLATPANPSTDHIFGVNVQALVAGGLSPADLLQFRKAHYGNGTVAPEVVDRVMDVVAKVQEGQ